MYRSSSCEKESSDRPRRNRLLRIINNSNKLLHSPWLTPPHCSAPIIQADCHCIGYRVEGLRSFRRAGWNRGRGHVFPIRLRLLSLHASDSQLQQHQASVMELTVLYYYHKIPNRILHNATLLTSFLSLVISIFILMILTILKLNNFFLHSTPLISHNMYLFLHIEIITP